jgi:hypothetical protein
VPELGLSWYFGGHQDAFTTAGWSIQTERIYLKSLLEFTHPGFTNNGVQGLGPGQGAGSDGAYRNITQGGIQSEAGFTERADGVLVYVPGWGANGILLGLAGGTNTTFVGVTYFILRAILLGNFTVSGIHTSCLPISYVCPTEYNAYFSSSYYDSPSPASSAANA